MLPRYCDSLVNLSQGWFVRDKRLDSTAMSPKIVNCFRRGTEEVSRFLLRKCFGAVDSGSNYDAACTAAGSEGGAEPYTVVQPIRLSSVLVDRLYSGHGTRR